MLARGEVLPPRSTQGGVVCNSSNCYFLLKCGVAQSSPVTDSCNEPCVRQCPDSEVVIKPSPVVVTLPGPILSNFPQQSEVAAIGAPVVGAGLGGHYGGLYGLGRLGGYRGLYGLYGFGGLWGYGRCGRRSLSGYCGPC
uniref:Keratin n=1 Tax=Gopherus evgoodei TaxID=1825980 RepID=A0A8C5F0Z0_9SAUR